MDLKVKQINGANASVATIIEASELAKAEDKIAKSFAKKAKIDGFRAGKVPVAVIKSRYKKEITQDAEQELLQNLLKDGLKELGKTSENMVGEPNFKKFDKKDGKIDVELEVSFRPEIDTKDYKECIPTYSTPRVTKKDIEAKKEELFKLVAPLKPLKDDRGIEDGDFALFDFEGFVDDKPFEGGKADGYTLEIGSGQFIPGFEEGMKGLKANEERDVKVTFPENYGGSDLAGKDAVFKVKLHEIQAKEVPSEPTEEMLKKLLPNEEGASVEKLEEEIKKQIRAEKLSKLYEDDLKPKFVEAIVEKIEFDLPENILEQELDMQVRQNWGTFTKEEIDGFKDNPDSLQEKRESYREDASKSVKLTFIVDELARQKGINIKDEEVMQRLYFEAMQQGQDPKAYVEMYEKQGLLPAIKMSMIEEKLFRTLFFEDKEEKKESKKDSKKEEK